MLEIVLFSAVFEALVWYTDPFYVHLRLNDNHPLGLGDAIAAAFVNSLPLLLSYIGARAKIQTLVRRQGSNGFFFF